jgi:hypothetical protein
LTGNRPGVFPSVRHYGQQTSLMEGPDQNAKQAQQAA